MSEPDEFHHWLDIRRAEWLTWRAAGGSLMTFAEYLHARALFLEENKNG